MECILVIVNITGTTLLEFIVLVIGSAYSRIRFLG